MSTFFFSQWIFLLIENVTITVSDRIWQHGVIFMLRKWGIFKCLCFFIISISKCIIKCMATITNDVREPSSDQFLTQNHRHHVLIICTSENNTCRTLHKRGFTFNGHLRLFLSAKVQLWSKTFLKVTDFKYMIPSSAFIFGNSWT